MSGATPTSDGVVLPGHRGVETSIEAADHVAPHVARLQGLALDAISTAGAQGLTTRELAALLEIDPASIQPRTSELRAERRIIDSGRRRKNPSGVNAIVWTLPEFEEPPR